MSYRITEHVQTCGEAAKLVRQMKRAGFREIHSEQVDPDLFRVRAEVGEGNMDEFIRLRKRAKKSNN